MTDYSPSRVTQSFSWILSGRIRAVILSSVIKI